MIWGENPLFSETSICFSRKLHSFLERSDFSQPLRPPRGPTCAGSRWESQTGYPRVLVPGKKLAKLTHQQTTTITPKMMVKNSPPKKIRPSDYFSTLCVCFLAFFSNFKIRGTLELRWKRGSMSWLRWPSLDWMHVFLNGMARPKHW